MISLACVSCWTSSGVQPGATSFKTKPSTVGSITAMSVTIRVTGIENRLFHVKDDSFGEDRYVLQSHHRGRVMSLLRATALNLLRGGCNLWKDPEPLTGRAQRVCARPLVILGGVS